VAKAARPARWPSSGAPLFALDDAALRLGGEVVSGAISCPGSGHSRKDRSLRVFLDPHAPLGFRTHSFAGDDWRSSEDFVAVRLGLQRERKTRKPEPRPPSKPERKRGDTAEALAVWRASVDPRGTVVERYLSSRGLDLDDGLASEVIRWHPGIGAMVALFRDIRTNGPKAITRMYLDREGRLRVSVDPKCLSRK
jgi:putative DNA primase/helicase